jgi:hypothetical protein
VSEAQHAFLEALRSDGAHLERDLAAICDFGGRRQGTSSADKAFAFVREALAGLGAGTLSVYDLPYHGWTLEGVGISIPGEADPVPCASLVGSVPTQEEWVELEILDLGRGTPADIAAAGSKIRGKAVLLRHEYAFATDTIHRRVKLKAAADAGAGAVVMVQPFEGYGPVAGGANSCPVPGFGVGIEGARRLIAAGRARFRLRAHHHAATAPQLILDIPGKGPGYVVLSAHLDGHELGESAIDNATGVAALMSIARVAAAMRDSLPRGLRVCVFGAEEWSLSGSRAWLRLLPETEIAAMGLNVNLDSIAGSPNLTALTSCFPALDGFVRSAAREVGYELAVHEPISVSSDHANFAAKGIPALRLIAGFNEPECNLSRLLTAADTRDAVPLDQLRRATEVAGILVWHGLTAGDDELAALRVGRKDVTSAMKALAPLPA